MDIQTLEITKINPAPYNPRKDLQPGDVEYEKLKKSITEFDMVEPLVWNKRSGNLVGGHQRLKILKAMDIKSVEVSVVDLSETKEKALNLALNKISGEWDFLALKDLLQELDTGAFDIEITGFDLKEIEDLMTQFHVPEEGLTDDDAVPEPTESITCKGDLWKLGNHRLLCGDATIITDVEKLMGGKKADMVFTDPPYRMETEGGGVFQNSHSMKQVKQNRVDSFDPSSLLLHAPVNIYFHNKPLIGEYIALAARNKANYDLAIYHKGNIAPNYNSHLMTDLEYIAIVGDLDPNKGLEKQEYSKLYTGDKDGGNDLSYSKPVDLCCKFIKLYSRQSVLDLFGGSGSTLIACEKLGRRCFMMEIDKHYCDVIIKRWEDYTGKKAVRIDG